MNYIKKAISKILGKMTLILLIGVLLIIIVYMSQFMKVNFSNFSKEVELLNIEKISRYETREKGAGISTNHDFVMEILTNKALIRVKSKKQISEKLNENSLIYLVKGESSIFPFLNKSWICESPKHSIKCNNVSKIKYIK